MKLLNGRKIFETAAASLGYTVRLGAAVGASELEGQALAAVNRIYADLWWCAHPAATDFVPLACLEEAPDLPMRMLYDVMPYGVAMLLARGEGDSDGIAVYTSLYNQKRRSAARTGKMTDIFSGGDGE